MTIKRWQAGRLRGLIAHHVDMQTQLSWAGSMDPKDADTVRANAAKAEQRMYAYIRKLTKKTPKRCHLPSSS